MSHGVLVVAVLGALAGCKVTATFTCERDDQCRLGGETGVCQPSGFCSFTDPGCESGLRYDDAAEDALAGTCTEPLEIPCYGTGLVEVCPDPSPTAALVLAGAIDTTADPRCDASIAATCTIIAKTITVDGAVVATGARPLVLVAGEELVIAGTGSIDVASHARPEVLGAGADDAACTGGTPPTAGAVEGGGGFGGSFGGAGGNGGNGGQMGVGGVAAPALAMVTTVRGGCPGTAGARMNSGIAGHGGGAVYLVAGVRIRLDGTINASGSSGGGAAGGNMTNGGGGGGGSGGLVGLDAPEVAFGTTAIIFANGGGGGEGGGLAAGTPGADPVAPGTAPAMGGGNTSGGSGDGGAGAAGAMLAGMAGMPAGMNQNNGGGGGGGGAGVVLVFSTTTTGTGAISPPPR